MLEKIPAPDPSATPAAVVHRSHLRDLDPVALYRIARLRETVFCLEQRATDADLDGRELEDGTVLLWIDDAGDAEPAAQTVPLAHARVLTDPEAMRIGRVVVRADARRDGVARTIVLPAHR